MDHNILFSLKDNTIPPTAMQRLTCMAYISITGPEREDSRVHPTGLVLLRVDHLYPTH